MILMYYSLDTKYKDTSEYKSHREFKRPHGRKIQK
jgi:hypothetical protein